MKLSLSTIIAVALILGVWAEGPVEKATEVAEDALTQPKCRTQSVKGTKKVVNKVVDAVTPIRTLAASNVTLSDEKIDMPTSLETARLRS